MTPLEQMAQRLDEIQVELSTLLGEVARLQEEVTEKMYQAGLDKSL